MTYQTKNQLVWGVRFLVSALFIISAMAKLYPSPILGISAFETKYLGAIGIENDIAKIISRMLIGFEFSLAILLLLPYYLKKVIIPATITLLSIFSLHLLVQIINGEGGNCGCFGELIPMTPTEALIKNILTIGLLLLLLTYFKDSFKEFLNVSAIEFFKPLIFGLVGIGFFFFLSQDLAKYMLISLPIIALLTTLFSILLLRKNKLNRGAMFSPIPICVLGFILAMFVFLMPVNSSNFSAESSTEYSILYNSIQKKKILCYFDPSCEHCRDAAKEIVELKKANKNFPEVKILFMDAFDNGMEEEIGQFFEYIGMEFDYQLLSIQEFNPIFWDKYQFPGVLYMYEGEKRIFFEATSNPFDSSRLMEEINKDE